jgi:hypothetical protein
MDRIKLGIYKVDGNTHTQYLTVNGKEKKFILCCNHPITKEQILDKMYEEIQLTN